MSDNFASLTPEQKLNLIRGPVKNYKTIQKQNTDHTDGWRAYLSGLDRDVSQSSDWLRGFDDSKSYNKKR